MPLASAASTFLISASMACPSPVAVYPQIGAARTLVDGGWPTEPMSGLFAFTPHYAVPLFVLGIATAAIAAPYTLRLVVRAVRG